MAGLVPGVAEIERVDGTKLSYRQFLERFAGPGIPVLIYNYAEWILPSQQWNPRKLRDICGDRVLDFSYQYDQALQLLIQEGLSDQLEVRLLSLLKHTKRMMGDVAVSGHRETSSLDFAPQCSP